MRSQTLPRPGGPHDGVDFALRALGLALLVLLPQLRVLFEREGWPDLVILIDDSKSMEHVDEEPGGASQSRLDLVQSF